MGAEPYCYLTDYQSDIQAALDLLREREFAAGRYEPCFWQKTGKFMFELGLAPRHTFPAPGPCHESLDDLYADMDEGGTGSILDIANAVSDPFSQD